jgi:2-succinyl-5-enolpyruvyl-6-hydroxy-3-cyclohexene-1-carboxylate synthase
MDAAKTNYAFAAAFADQLAAAGVAGVCLSPGSRSAALAVAFARHPGLRVWVHVDERSGAFFGLGLARATGRPAVLLCTSGTAAAEFHPAVVEAYHSRVPLIVLTADRPPELIDVGANQAIDQRAIYGSAVRWFHDPGVPAAGPGDADRWRRLAARAVAEAAGPPAGPVHLNLPFREPLLPAPGDEPPAAGATREVVAVHRGRLEPAVEMIDRLQQALAAARRPVLVAGGLRAGARLRSAVAALQLPVLAEPTSQLRIDDLWYDALLRDEAWGGDHQPDLVVRVGAPMTSKPLNQWLAASRARTFVVDEGGGWADPDLAATDLYRCDPQPILESMAQVEPDPAWTARWRQASLSAQEAIDDALPRLPLFEAHAVRALAGELRESRAAVMVGSSMPIRDVDTFWPASSMTAELFANRGASGIDGLVSTGLGVAAARPDRPTVLLLGDLATYHDMNGLWALRRHGLRATVVVLDNDGGGIFSFLPQVAHTDVFEEVFGTPLGLRMEDVARLHGLEFAAADQPDELGPVLHAALMAPGSVLVAVRFRREDSVTGHRAVWSAVTDGLRRGARRSGRGA